MKIYAKQISPENQESPLFLGEEFWPEGIILDGNRDYTSRTISAYDDIKRYFDDMAAAWENEVAIIPMRKRQKAIDRSGILVSVNITLRKL